MDAERTIRISLPNRLFDALRDSAIQECRHPKDHARYILQTALLGNNSEKNNRHDAKTYQGQSITAVGA